MIEVALKAGFAPQQIVFTGVGKSAAEIARAVALGLKAINAESRGELERIDAESSRQGRRTRVALRVNPDVGKALKANNGKALLEMEEMTKKTVIVKSDPALHQEQFDIN